MFGKLGDLSNLLKNAGKIQDMVKEAQEKLSKIEVTGEAGAGAVKISFNAQHYAKSVLIDDDILKEDKIILQDLIAAAINDATQRIEKEKEKMMGGAAGGDMFGGMFGGSEK